MDGLEKIIAQKNLIEAVDWRVKVNGKERSIQLFDIYGNAVSGDRAYWNGYFDCSGNSLTSLVGAPQVVGEWFNCSDNNLTSLEGAPQAVGWTFNCSKNKLNNLEGAPKIVGWTFNCENSNLTSLVGAPQVVVGWFKCSYNNLISLVGAPQVVGWSFNCSHNNLTSLEGAPQVVGASFYCSHNHLTNLKGAPQMVGASFYCSHNHLTNLKGAPQMVGRFFYCSDNKLASLKGAPKERTNVFPHFLKLGYVFADGILTKLISKKQNLFKTREIGTNNMVWIASNDDQTVFAHADTAREAVQELNFKTSDVDLEEYGDINLNDRKSPDEWAIIYRNITGACRYGVKHFIEGRAALKDNYSLKEIINLTEGRYGHGKFVSFFKKG